jgi:RimJ/RimL family protein N-acetyltransferase
MILASPFPRDAAPELWRWLNSPAEPNFLDGSPRDLAGVTAALDLKTAQGITFAAMIDGRPAGFIGISPASREMAWFAGMVIAPEHRGHGLGTTFLRAVVRDLNTRGVRKLSALFFADNHAVRAAFAKAGAVEEGYLKSAAMRNGEMTDMRLSSFTTVNK